MATLNKKPYHPIRNQMYAIRGFYDALMFEKSLRIQLGLGILSIGVSIWQQSYLMTFLNFMFAIIVISGEMFNTALERLCDLVQPERDERVRIIKDIAAAAVLTLAVGWGSLMIIQFASIFLNFQLV